MTIACLLSNTVRAFRLANDINEQQLIEASKVAS